MFYTPSWARFLDFLCFPVCLVPVHHPWPASAYNVMGREEPLGNPGAGNASRFTVSHTVLLIKASAQQLWFSFTLPLPDILTFVFLSVLFHVACFGWCVALMARWPLSCLEIWLW